MSLVAVDDGIAPSPGAAPELGTAEPSLQRRNDEIQYLRGYAALMVVLGHAMNRLSHRDPSLAWLAYFDGDFGGMGVQIFFVISGFIMVAIAWNEFGRAGAPLRFWTARVKRIAPLYYVATAMLLILPSSLGGRVFPASQVAASFLFLPVNARPEDGFLRPVLGIGWTLTYEMFFYGVFGLTLLLTRRSGLLVGIGVLAMLVGLGKTVVPGTGVSPFSPVYFYTYHLVGLFAVGMILGLFYRSRLFRASSLPYAALVGATLASFAIIAFNSTMPGVFPLWRTAVMYALAALAVLLCVVARPRPRNRLLELLGDASFSIYLFHGFALSAVIFGYEAVFGLQFPLLRIVLCVLIAPAFGVLMYRLVEQPIVRLLKPRSRQAREG